MNVCYTFVNGFCSGDENEIICGDGLANDKTITFARQFKRLLLFSGNDYLGLSSHPTIAKAAARVCFTIYAALTQLFSFVIGLMHFWS